MSDPWSTSSASPWVPDPAVAMSDDRLREALREANVPVLLLVLFHLTGERRWLREPFRPSRAIGLDDNATGGLSPEVQSRVRVAAYDALRAWRDGRPMAVPVPDPEMLSQMLGFSMGEPVGPEYGPMIAAELGLAPDIEVPIPDLPSDFEVLIVGTGLSGLMMAKRLLDAGIECRLVERQRDLGGTWRDNRYPGCGVDTPSAIYSFSFFAHPWSRFFADRDEVQRYLQSMAEAEHVRERIEFDRTVEYAAYDEERQRWRVITRTEAGKPVEYCPNALISAVGVFSEPRWPDVPGLPAFAGDLVHTAEWDDRLRVAGRRVGVIGNGASAMQLVPAVVDEVASLTVFQRSAQWVAPFPQLHAEIPEVLRELSMAVPLYRQWYRVRAGWTFNDRLHSSLQRDPTWDHPERSVSGRNDEHRKFFTAYLEDKLDGRQDLRAALLPTYPPFGKRILLDNGWFDALCKPSVTLETQKLDRVEGGEVVLEDGSRHTLDVLVCATGFHAVRFLSSMEVVGRHGKTLRELWHGDDARAYLGTTVPGFPNLFIMYGPNVQAGHGGSLTGLAEMQSHYIVDLLRKMIQSEGGSIEVRHDVWERYNDEVDRAHDAMVWTHPGMSTYYRNSRGRVVVPGPFRIVDLWHRTRRAKMSEYILRARSLIAGGRR